MTFDIYYARDHVANLARDYYLFPNEKRSSVTIPNDLIFEFLKNLSDIYDECLILDLKHNAIIIYDDYIE